MEYTNYDEESKETFAEFCYSTPWCTNLTFTEPVDAPNDAFYNSGSTHIIGELKARNVPSWAYDSAILETKKLIELKAMATGNTRIHYTFIYSDGFVRIWDVTNVDPYKSTTKMLDKTTAEESDKIPKKVVYLMNEAAIITEKL